MMKLYAMLAMTILAYISWNSGKCTNASKLQDLLYNCLNTMYIYEIYFKTKLFYMLLDLPLRRIWRQRKSIENIVSESLPEGLVGTNLPRITNAYLSRPTTPSGEASAAHSTTEHSGK